MKFIYIIIVLFFAFSSCTENKIITKTKEPMFIGTWNVVNGKDIIQIKSDGKLIFDNYELQDKIVNYKFVEPDTIMWIDDNPLLPEKYRKDYITIALCSKDSLYLNLKIKGKYTIVKYYKLR